MTTTERCCPMSGGRRLAGSDYRNLFGPPEPSEVYPGLNEPTLAKLAQRMLLPFDWELSDAPREPPSAEGPIPAGYTYLAQLVAHDMVQSVAPLDAVGGGTGVPRNFRRTPLVLDTVYGGGPLVSPLAYASDAGEPTPGERRSRLRLGRSRESTETRDIARYNALAYGMRQAPGVPDAPMVTNDEANVISTLVVGVGEFRNALIADPRNDDNMFVSQLLVLFHLLHNIVLQKVGESANGNDEGTNLHRFRVTRQIVALIYRRIVRCDLMARILHPAVHEAYEARFRDRTQMLDPAGCDRMPVEFSHAAFRFGHAMIRSDYRINETLEAFGKPVGHVTLANALAANGDGGLAHVLPFGPKWWVNWSNFFQVHPGAPSPQHAMRIAPLFATELKNDRLVAHFDRVEHGGLPYRDLLRSSQIGMRKVESLYRKVAAAGFQLPGRLTDTGMRRQRIAAWLNRHPEIGFATVEVDQISENPPLSFYVLFEAAVETGGETLGGLGSVIVAETVYGALQAQRAAFEDNGALAALCTGLFPGGAPETAAALVRHVAEQPRFQALA